MKPNWIERIIFALSLGVIVFVICLYGCIARAQDVVRISPPQPPIPALPVVIGSVTNSEGAHDVVLVKKRTNAPPKMDMPPPLPVSVSAPHHYYGIAEFKRTGDGKESENEVFYFGLYPNEEAFRRSHGVGNSRFNRKFKAVFRYPSELPLDLTCIWQRADGPAP